MPERKSIAEELVEYNWLKELLKALIKVDDSDLLHLKLKVNYPNVAVNQEGLKRLKEILEKMDKDKGEEKCQKQI